MVELLLGREFQLRYARAVAGARKQLGRVVKVVDEATPVHCVSGNGTIREEVWEVAPGMSCGSISLSSTFIFFRGIAEGFWATIRRTGSRTLRQDISAFHGRSR
jgi:hypothetical protein